jgi:tripartite-type tricarboxylate transporter receptor subunit TctC
VDFGVQTFSSTLAHIREGKVIALAVSARERSTIMPEVPTVIEAGLSRDAVYPFYSALYLPAKTPREIVEKLHREAAKALEAPAVRERLASMGVEPMPMSVDQFGRFFREDVAANLALAQAARIKLQ